MNKNLFYTALVFLVFFPIIVTAQSMPVNNNVFAKHSFVRTVYNVISNYNELDSFYQKLYRLKSTQTGTVSIVHIGDSHIQPDFLPAVVRNGLQDFFGNAGRGLVFPYQLAQSNAPDDISSSSNVQWQYNRAAHPEIDLPYGISGFGIITNSPNVTINMSLKDDPKRDFSFNRLKFFLDENENNSWKLDVNNNDKEFYLLKNENKDSVIYQQVDIEQPATSFSLSSLASSNAKKFYGVCLENAEPGIIYHTIGVNGARYDHYNIASLFWKQLPALKADLYIISLGTNEAQAAKFNEAAFIEQLSLFIKKLKQISPGAAIIITTAPDSYKKKRYNTVLRSLNTAITNYCNKNSIPLWDLYRITNGYGSAYSWAKRGLMNKDRIHFTADGYRLQGSLLLNALAKGYNNYQHTIE